METGVRICAKFVVSEVIDGEAVIMDLRSGNYFSATGAGGPIWGDLEAGRSYAAILQSLVSRYRLDAAELKLALDKFLGELLAQNLVEPCDDEAPAPEQRAEFEPGLPEQRFEPPVLTIHTDMQDLLLLDPIHDVDAAGWPVRKA